MNYKIVSKLLSMIFAILAGAILLSLGVSFIYRAEALEQSAMSGWLISLISALVISFAFYLPSRNAQMKLFKREAFCIIALGWLATSLFGALPFMLIVDAHYADAIFESTSGFSTTGASAFASVVDFPKSLLFWRALSQWIGGLGVVVFFVAILSFLGAGARILYSYESSANSSEHDTGKIKNGIAKIFYLYISISVLCFITYYLCGLDCFQAFCYMLTTVPSGGFALYETYMSEFNSPALEWAMIVFMFIAGLSFIFMLSLIKGNFTYVKKNTEFWTYLLMCLIAALILALPMIDFSNMSFANLHNSYRSTLFEVLSIVTTTGYSVGDYTLWEPMTQILLFILMCTGACAGSTSGGLKLSRVITSIKLTFMQIEKSYRPKVIRPLMINGKALDDDSSNQVLGFVVLYALLFFIGIFLISIFESDMSFAGAISSVISSLSNVGPALAEVGPSHSYSFMTDASKILLAFLMILGRIEIYAILALFVPSFWRTFR
ncbi:MAG: TrkH family potassium uptake protein [Opitutales bacterium]